MGVSDRELVACITVLDGGTEAPASTPVTSVYVRQRSAQSVAVSLVCYNSRGHASSCTPETPRRSYSNHACPSTLDRGVGDRYAREPTLVALHGAVLSTLSNCPPILSLGAVGRGQWGSGSGHRAHSELPRSHDLRLAWRAGWVRHAILFSPCSRVRHSPSSLTPWYFQVKCTVSMPDHQEHAFILTVRTRPACRLGVGSCGVCGCVRVFCVSSGR